MIIFKNEVELNLRFPFKIERYVLNKQDNTKESFHWHSFFEITFIESGIGNYFVSEKTFAVEANDFIIFNNTEPHGWEILSETMVVIVMIFSIDFISERIGSFDYDYLQPFIEYGSNFKNKIEKNEIASNQMRLLLTEIYKEYNEQAVGYQLMVKANILKLLTLLIRHYTDNSKSKEPLANKNVAMKRLEKVFIYMYNHYSEKITLEEMAHECFMSPNYFSSYFKKITECTFINYLHGIRVRQAQKLLNTSDMGIAQIALDCGFNNISNFYRIYKNFTGKNPGDERNRTHKTKQEM